jgi:RNA polymerase sigma-70 factor (ECF subfamily)
MNDNTDQLARAFRGGDIQAFRKLVENLTRSLIALAYRYTIDWESARDLTQETWLTVYRQIHRYDTGKPFKAWLFAVHRNRCLSYLRRPVVTQEQSVDSSSLESLQCADPTPDPLQNLESREFEGRIREALGCLSESQRQVFVLVDLEQGNQEEVAAMLSMKHTTLRTTLHFARRRLAEWLLETEESVCVNK